MDNLSKVINIFSGILSKKEITLRGRAAYKEQQRRGERELYRRQGLNRRTFDVLDDEGKVVRRRHGRSPEVRRGFAVRGKTKPRDAAPTTHTEPKPSTPQEKLAQQRKEAAQVEYGKSPEGQAELKRLRHREDLDVQGINYDLDDKGNPVRPSKQLRLPGLMEKSRFEQQPVKGNFIPRPDPKKNTTEGGKSVLLTKESPRPVPGVPGNVSRPNSKEKTGGKGKKVGGLFETDGSTPDDSTYIIGLEKVDRSERFGRQVSRAKRDAQEARRDKAQKETYEGSPGRRLKTGDPTSPKKRSSVLSRSGGDDPEITPEAFPGSEVADTTRIYTTGLGRDVLRRRRRAGIKENGEGQLESKVLPSRGEPRKYSTGTHPGWERTRGARRTLAAKTETTPTSTSGRSYRYRDVDTRGAALKVSGRGTDEWNRGDTRNWGTRRWGSDKDKNINRETINPNKMEKSKDNNIYTIAKAVYEYLHKKQEPNPEKLKELLDAGKITQEQYDGLVSGEVSSVKVPSAAAKRMSAMNPLQRAQQRASDRKKLGEAIWAEQAQERAMRRRGDEYQMKSEDNIYAIATAAARGKGEKKKEEIVRALKRGKMLLKAFGVMKAPTSEENVAEFNRMQEAAEKHKAKRFAEERQIAPDSIDDDTVNYSVSDETHQYDSDEALRSKPAMKRVKEGMRRRGRPEAEIKHYTDQLIEQDKYDHAQRTGASLAERYPGDSIKNMEKSRILKAFGIRKATEAERKRDKAISEGTRYTPEDLGMVGKPTGRKVDDIITEGSGHQSGYNPPPHRRKLKLQTRPHRPNVDEETYEDVERQTQRRDEGYQAGQPSGQRVGRRGDTRGYKGETADIGPRQRFMDVGRTGATPKSAKPTGRTAITAREPDRGKTGGQQKSYFRRPVAKRPKSARKPSWDVPRHEEERVSVDTSGPSVGVREAGTRGMGVQESEPARKKRLAALSPEERSKSEFQRLREADEKVKIKARDASLKITRSSAPKQGKPAKPGRAKRKKSVPARDEQGKLLTDRRRKEHGATYQSQSRKKSLKSRLDKLNEKASALQRLISESQPVDKRPQLMMSKEATLNTEKLLKAFGLIKAPTSEENVARWNQEAREWKQQAGEHYEEDAPQFDEAGIPESAARYHTGRDQVQYQSDASMRSDPAFRRMRGDVDPSERESFTDRTFARERKHQKEGTAQSLDQMYPGDSLKNMEKASILKAFGLIKAPTSEENARKLNEQFENEKQEHEELARQNIKFLQERGLPEERIPKDAVRFASRVSAPSNLYTSEENYRRDPDLETATGGSEIGRQKIVGSAKRTGKNKAEAWEKAKYGDWTKPGESSIQNLKKTEEDKSVEPIRSVALNRRRKEAEILRAGRRELKEATKGLPRLKAAQVRREATRNYRQQRFGGVPGTDARHGRLPMGDGHVESTETKTVRPKAIRISDKVSAQGPARERVNTGMGKRGSDEPGRSVEESTKRMVRSGRALASFTRDDMAAGRTIAAKDPKAIIVKPDDYKIKLYKAFGIMKARSAANKAKNRRALGMRRTKAEGRKLDSIFRRAQNVERKLSPEENIEVITHPDVHEKPLLKPAFTAASIVVRNAERKRQGKPPIKNPYLHIDASGKESDFAHAAQVVTPGTMEDPGSWTPAQQRLMTDAEKGQQRAISRVGEQKIKAGKERQSKLGAIKRRADKQDGSGE